jgi:tetratricopeptide (TPR) repeat protein
MRTLVVAILVCLAGSAAATPTDKQLAEAKQHFQSGTALQKAGHYDEAIAEYHRVYELVAYPEMLFNIGQCQRLKGDKRAAVQGYRQYLAAAPEGPGASDAQAFIVSLSREIEDEDAATREHLRAEAAAARARAAEEATRRQQAEKAAADARRPIGHPGRTLRLAGLITAGAGVVLTGVGLGYAWRSHTLSERQSQTPFDPGLVDQGRAANRDAWLLGAVGGAAILGGGLLWYLGHRAERDVQIQVTPRSAAVLVSGRL